LLMMILYLSFMMITMMSIFSPSTIEEKTRYDYNIPPIFYDNGDENNIDRYIVEFAPTTVNKNDYVHVGSINSFMHMAHDNNVLCDSYIVNSIHDATESYYERGKHGFMHLNNIKFPLFMLKFLKLHLFCFPMLVAFCFHDLFLYKTLFHRKWFKFKFVSYFLFDALSCFKFFPALMWASSQITAPSSKALKKALLGDNPCFLSVIFLLLSLGSCYYCNDLSLSFYFVFVPRRTSNWKKVRFGKVNVLKQIFALHRKNSWKFPKCYFNLRFLVHMP
jgi:hypothetical protein